MFKISKTRVICSFFLLSAHLLSFGQENPYQHWFLFRGANGNIERPVTSISIGHGIYGAIQNDASLVLWGNMQHYKKWDQDKLYNYTRNVKQVAFCGNDKIYILSKDSTLFLIEDTLRPSPPLLTLGKLKDIWGGFGAAYAKKKNGQIVNLLTLEILPKEFDNAQEIAIGGDVSNETFSIVLKSDGTIKHLIGSLYGIPMPEGLYNVRRIAAGSTHALAIKEDGTVIAWGDDRFGQGDIPSSLQNVVAIAGGISFNAAVNKEGKVVLWGSADYTYAALEWNNIIDVKIHRNQVLALDASGLIYQRNTDEEPKDLKQITSMSGNQTFYLGLTSKGTIVGGGSNDYGQLSIPTDLANVTSIETGPSTSYAVKSDGSVMAWGVNQYHQVDTARTLQNVKSIASSEFYVTALFKDGTIKIFGDTSRTSGIEEKYSNVAQIDAGDYHTSLLFKDGTVKSFSVNYPWPYMDTANLVHLSNIQRISSSGRSTIALKKDGTTVCWGTAGYSGLYDCSLVPPMSNVKEVLATDLYLMVLTKSNRLYMLSEQGEPWKEIKMPLYLQGDLSLFQYGVYERSQLLLGQKEQTFGREAKLFPNPSKSTVTIEVNEPGTIRLYNKYGIKLQETLVSSVCELNLNSYPSDLYFVEFISESHTWRKKLIKE